MSFVTLLIVFAVGFFVVMQVLGAMRRGGSRVARVPKTLTPEEQALQKLFEKPIESETQLRELMLAAEASRKRKAHAPAQPEQAAAGLSDGLRAAMGIASVVAAEHIVTTAPTTKNKKEKKAHAPHVEVAHPERNGVRPVLHALAVLEPSAPLGPTRALRPFAPLSPIAPLAVRTARS
jgi:hypothetical protein